MLLVSTLCFLGVTLALPSSNQKRPPGKILWDPMGKSPDLITLVFQIPSE